MISTGLWIRSRKYAEYYIDITDGLKILLDDQNAWIHIRPSEYGTDSPCGQ